VAIPKADPKSFLNRYIGKNDQESGKERRERRQERREKKRERQYNASIPQEYKDKYGSTAGSMYERDKLAQRDVSTAMTKQGVTPLEIDRYGSDALNVARARQLNEQKKQIAMDTLTPGMEDRQKALDESFRLAQTAGIPGARDSKQATKDFYTKEFARFGNSANVFGMKDLLEMRNRGESEGDIRRIALTIGSVGPLARKELGI